jgi:beta-lactam-binding protein with PASTA domain
MRRILTYLIVVIIFFVIGALLANFVIMPYLVHMGEEISVPDVCNLPLETAIEELKKQGFDGVVTERRYDPIIEAGRVIIQDPLPDARAKKGRIINLSVSLGPETIRIPYLTGIDYEKGRLIISRLNLSVEAVDSVFSDSIPAGKIISTLPAFDAEVMNGSSVTLIVSRGSRLLMPDLVGMSEQEVRELLKGLGLILGEVKKVEGSGASGKVILQDPKPRQTVEPGDTVSLMVVK